MLFIATSHRLAELIFSLDNHCRQLSARERIDLKVQIKPELRFVKSNGNITLLRFFLSCFLMLLKLLAVMV